MKKNSAIRTNLVALVETALLIALAFILGRFKLFRMPQGGSVHPASMLPLCLIGLRHGKRWGFLGCFAYGILDFLLDGGFALNLWAILLDYLLAYTMLGITGFFKGKTSGIWLGMPIAVLGRFACHFASGVTVWADYTESHWSDVWLYSLSYNGTYLLVELALMMLLAFLMRAIWPRFIR